MSLKDHELYLRKQLVAQLMWHIFRILTLNLCRCRFLRQNPPLHRALVGPGHIKSVIIDEPHASMLLPKMAVLQIQVLFVSAKQDTPIIHQWKVMLDG
jgi:hypothetical protein